MSAPETTGELIASAREARERAYAPYSEFRVGAALRAASGAIYRGGNVENASYGLTICAERAAVFAAVAAGERQLVEIAIVSDSPTPTMPCGACRQVLREFGPDLRVVAAGENGSIKRAMLARLLPDAFTTADLEG